MNAKDVATALSSLGNTVEEVEASLLKHKIRGIAQRSCSCPITEYVKKIAGDTFVDTGYGAVYLGNNQSVPVPDPVADFIRRFDKLESPIQLYSDCPKWTPPLKVGKYYYQYRILYEKNGYATCPAAKKDGWHISKHSARSPWEVCTTADIKKAINGHLGFYPSKGCVLRQAVKNCRTI